MTTLFSASSAAFFHLLLASSSPSIQHLSFLLLAAASGQAALIHDMQRLPELRWTEAQADYWTAHDPDIVRYGW